MIEPYQIATLLKVLFQVMPMIRTSKEILWGVVADFSIRWSGSEICIFEKIDDRRTTTLHQHSPDWNLNTFNAPIRPVHLWVLSTKCDSSWTPRGIRPHWRRHVRCGERLTLYYDKPFISLREGHSIFEFHIFLEHVLVFWVVDSYWTKLEKSLTKLREFRPDVERP